MDEDYPIHLIRTIQPHGILLVIDGVDFSILQVSVNTRKYLGISPKQLLGKPLDSLCDTAPLRNLLTRLSLAQTTDQTANPTTDQSTAQTRPESSVIPVQLSVKTQGGWVAFDSFIHRTGGAIVVEMEPTNAVDDPEPVGFLSVHALVRETIARMRQSETRQALLHILVEDIRHLTGYDRVLIYRFDTDGAGEVIAEAHRDDLTPYRGLHFPARDVPAVCRDIYAQGKLRVIPHVQAKAVPLISLATAQHEQPLDMSLSMLRSPDACCAKYYSNMDVSATLTASLIKDKQLWGLISGHHTTPKKLSYEISSACELLAQIASAELANKVKQEDLDQQVRLNALHAELIASIAQSDNFVDALIKPEERLLTLVNASGAAICLGEELTLVGTTPTSAQVRSLISWATDKVQDNLFKTACLSHEYPEAEAFQATASGVLLLQISKVQRYQILWFRPEVLQTVSWGGEPDDGISVDEQGEILDLSPRRSFELWQETVQATALPWKSYEIEGAIALRNAIVGIVLKKADELAKLNRDLRASNRELASFAYAAAHDLKEPLRGIYNYASILIEDYASALDEDGLAYLNDIQLFSQRMEILINALLRIAGLRQTELHLTTVDLNELLGNAVEIMRASRPETPFTLRVARPLPEVECDPVLVNEVFRNLISNALKYNEQREKWIEVGYQAASSVGQDHPPAPVFYVRDNGIGIHPKHLSTVFQLFKRLHPQEQYDGGAGVGLAVVNQIIERHGGHIWIESALGEGSTFYFTL